MSTFLEMQEAIEDYILRTDINPQVQKAINRAIAKYSKARFWFTETEESFNTVQGDWFYGIPPVPSDIRQIDYLRITVNNVYYEVIQRNIQWIIDANVNNNQGQPTDWAWWQNRIYFYPVPQDAYPITIFYQKSYAPLVDPTDENDFTTIPEAEDLIEAEALRWLYKKVILDPQKAEEYKIEAKDCLRVLNEINESMTGIEGNIEPTQW